MISAIGILLIFPLLTSINKLWLRVINLIYTKTDYKLRKLTPISRKEQLDMFQDFEEEREIQEKKIERLIRQNKILQDRIDLPDENGEEIKKASSDNSSPKNVATPSTISEVTLSELDYNLFRDIYKYQSATEQSEIKSILKIESTA